MARIDPARADQLTEAFGLAFQHLLEQDRAARVQQALSMVAAGEIDPAGVLTAWDGGQLVGVVVSIALPGAGSVLWPPAVAPGLEGTDLADRLVRTCLEWLASQGTKLGQALLTRTELPQANPLLRNGFSHVTQLLYMKHELTDLPAESVEHQWRGYSEPWRSMFQDTVLRTYEGSLDCPELNGVRTIEEILEGHRFQGVFHPERWQLALSGNDPVGALLLTELQDRPVWDLSYLGVVPEARGRGIGRALTLRALHLAKRARARQLTLAVDIRNHPASQLYHALGFIPTETREVFLAFLGKR